jgi:NADPH2:quinone reductase
MPVPETIRAVAFDSYGGPDVLQLRQVASPVPAAGEIAVRVEAAAVDPADVHFRSGGLARMISGPPPYVGGLEFAGTVVAAGPEARLTPGTRVAAITSFIPHGRGAHAEVVVVPDASAAALPDGMDAVAASIVPMSGLTAQRAMDVSDLATGSTLVVTGAGGAVGGYGTQLAAALGVRVIAVVSQRYADRVREYGADEAVPPGPDLVERVTAMCPGGVDALLDTALIGPDIRGMLAPGGRFLAVRSGGHVLEDVDYRMISVRDYERDTARLERLIALAADGRLRSAVAAVHPVDEAVEAHRRLEAGGVGGRLVLDFRG